MALPMRWVRWCQVSEPCALIPTRVRSASPPQNLFVVTSLQGSTFPGGVRATAAHPHMNSIGSNRTVNQVCLGHPTWTMAIRPLHHTLVTRPQEHQDQHLRGRRPTVIRRNEHASRTREFIHFRSNRLFIEKIYLSTCALTHSRYDPL